MITIIVIIRIIHYLYWDLLNPSIKLIHQSLDTGLKVKVINFLAQFWRKVFFTLCLCESNVCLTSKKCKSVLRNNICPAS